MCMCDGIGFIEEGGIKLCGLHCVKRPHGVVY